MRGAPRARGRPTLPWRRWRRAVVRHRRALAAACAGLAVWSGVRAVAPPPPPTVTVLAAARDLAAGTALAEADLRPLALPVAAVPDGALRPGAEVLGRLVAGPVRRGEPLTDARLAGPSLLAAGGYGADVVGVPVRLADPALAPLLRPGDRVDVYAVPSDPLARPPDAAADAAGGAGGTDAAAGTARVVATGVPVVTVLADADDHGALDAGVVLLLAAPPDTARAVAHAAATGRVSVALRGGP